MSIASKFRNTGIVATSAAVALASLSFNHEAQGQEPVRTQPTATKVSAANANTQAVRAEPILLRAGNHSEANEALSIVVLKGKQNEAGLTGKRIYQLLADKYATYQGPNGRSIQTKDFIEPGGDYTTIVYFVKGQLYGPYGLDDAARMIPVIASDYYDAHVVPGAPSKVAGSNTTASVINGPGGTN